MFLPSFCVVWNFITCILWGVLRVSTCQHCRCHHQNYPILLCKFYFPYSTLFLKPCSMLLNPACLFSLHSWSFSMNVPSTLDRFYPTNHHAYRWLQCTPHANQLAMIISLMTSTHVLLCHESNINQGMIVNASKSRDWSPLTICIKSIIVPELYSL